MFSIWVWCNYSVLTGWALTYLARFLTLISNFGSNARFPTWSIPASGFVNAVENLIVAHTSHFLGKSILSFGGCTSRDLNWEVWTFISIPTLSEGLYLPSFSLLQSKRVYSIVEIHVCASSIKGLEFWMLEFQAVFFCLLALYHGGDSLWLIVATATLGGSCRASFW